MKDSKTFLNGWARTDKPTQSEGARLYSMFIFGHVHSSSTHQ